jgi:hypothetical protein
MVNDSISHNTNAKTRQYGLWALSALLLLVCVLLCSTCHRMPNPLDEDHRLPDPYRSPERTFETWVKATLSADEAAIRDCYWPDMKPEEMTSWMRENLRPQAKELFEDAKLIEVRPATLVEVNFTFTVMEGSEEIRGVMVKTKQGWKIQSW